MNSTLKVLTGAAVIGLMAMTTTTASAYTWSVTVPADLNSSITGCTVILHDKTPNSGVKDISRGNSATWSSANVGGVSSPITYVSGRCQYTMAGRTYEMQLKGRTCSGVDFTNAVDGTINCSANVRLKICQKQASSSLYDYSYGFCPN